MLNRTFVATGLLFDKQHRVLLLKRSTNSRHFVDHWQLPEGKIEHGEQPYNALEREIQEELGVAIQSPRLMDIVLTVGTGDYADQEILRAVYIIMFHEVISPQLSSEHSDFRWVDITAIPKEWSLFPGTDTLLRLAKKEHL